MTESIKITKSTYDAMDIISKTFNFVGTYKFTHQDGEIIEGYHHEEVNENNKDEYMPIVKVECIDGYFYATNYKNDIQNKL